MGALEVEMFLAKGDEMLLLGAGEYVSITRCGYSEVRDWEEVQMRQRSFHFSLTYTFMYRKRMDMWFLFPKRV